jgi:hypothetical protein
MWGGGAQIGLNYFFRPSCFVGFNYDFVATGYNTINNQSDFTTVFSPPCLGDRCVASDYDPSHHGTVDCPDGQFPVLTPIATARGHLPSSLELSRTAASIWAVNLRSFAIFGNAVRSSSRSRSCFGR